MNYDIIGDIHGHADELKILLQKLGYQRTSEGVFTQLGRQVIYVGVVVKTLCSSFQMIESNSEKNKFLLS